MRYPTTFRGKKKFHVLFLLEFLLIFFLVAILMNMFILKIIRFLVMF